MSNSKEQDQSWVDCEAMSDSDSESDQNTQDPLAYSDQLLSDAAKQCLKIDQMCTDFLEPPMTHQFLYQGASQNFQVKIESEVKNEVLNAPEVKQEAKAEVKDEVKQEVKGEVQEEDFTKMKQSSSSQDQNLKVVYENIKLVQQKPKSDLKRLQKPRPKGLSGRKVRFNVPISRNTTTIQTPANSPVHNRAYQDDPIVIEDDIEGVDKAIEPTDIITIDDNNYSTGDLNARPTPQHQASPSYLYGKCPRCTCSFRMSIPSKQPNSR